MKDNMACGFVVDVALGRAECRLKIHIPSSWDNFILSTFLLLNNPTLLDQCFVELS